jgi:hypothetical protein
MINCSACGFGHKTSEELRACVAESFQHQAQSAADNLPWKIKCTAAEEQLRTASAELNAANLRIRELEQERDRLRSMLRATCSDCRDCAKHAYSDATTPEFFYDMCSRHREGK